MTSDKSDFIISGMETRFDGLSTVLRTIAKRSLARFLAVVA
jgi:hypothetical protein